MTEIKIRLFGAFRDLSPSGTINLEIPSEIAMTGIKNLIGLKLDLNQNTSALLGSSVLADDSKILRDHEHWNGQKQLALLPPVCGG